MYIADLHIHSRYSRATSRELTPEQLDARILRDFDEAKNKRFKNSLNRLFPAKLVPVMVARSGIDPEKKVNEVTAKERERLVEAAK